MMMDCQRNTVTILEKLWFLLFSNLLLPLRKFFAELSFIRILKTWPVWVILSSSTSWGKLCLFLGKRWLCHFILSLMMYTVVIVACADGENYISLIKSVQERDKTVKLFYYIWRSRQSWCWIICQGKPGTWLIAVSGHWEGNAWKQEIVRPT